MLRFVERAIRDPLGIIGTLWPLVLLAPFVPGLPRPQPSGLAWRQETVLALLISVTLGLLLKRARQRGDSFLIARREEFYLVLPLALFVLWSAASFLWAASAYPVFHHTLSWGAYLLFFLLMRRVAERPRLLTASLVTLAIVFLIISTACAIGAWGATISLFRYNGLGEPLAVVVPLFAALALGLRRTRVALLCAATTLMSWLAMLQAFERTPFLSASAGLLLLGAASLAFPKFRPRSLRRTAFLIIAFAAVTTLQMMPSSVLPGVVEPQHTVFSRLKSTSTIEENTQSRFLFWGIALEMSRQHPLVGVGANNYEVALPESRADLSNRHPDSPLVKMVEGHLVMRVHNEYLQILAELGAVGILLFAAFSVALVWTAWRALRRARRSPLVPGAIASLLTFAMSSGASSISFRWMGSGLLFFFAAALVTRFAAGPAARDEEARDVEEARTVPARFFKPGMATVVAFAFALLMFGSMAAQAMNVIMHGAAQMSATPVQADSRYRSALFWNPHDAATHFNYGMWLYHRGRASEAVAHLRYGVERGFNASTCYAYLATAEAEAGDTQASERTLAYALKVYPRSVFLRVRYASALLDAGKVREADAELATALSHSDATARSWWYLMRFGKEAAALAAQTDERVASPGILYPEAGVFLVIAEYERRARRSSTADEALSADTR